LRPLWAPDRRASSTSTIYRWSTDEERERLLTTLQEFGPDKLLDALEKVRPPVGAIRTATSLSCDLYYARNNPSPDGGRRVILATNRPVSFRELRNTPAVFITSSLFEITSSL